MEKPTLETSNRKKKNAVSIHNNSDSKRKLELGIFGGGFTESYPIKNPAHDGGNWHKQTNAVCEYHGFGASLFGATFSQRMSVSGQEFMSSYLV